MKVLYLPLLRSTKLHRSIGVVFAVSAFLIGVVVALHLWKDIPVGDLTRDPIILGKLPVHIGFLSQIGLFIWSASATLCLFSFAILARHEKHRKFRQFLLVSGLLTMLLALDDAFLMHEFVLPSIGIPQNFVLGSYVVFVLLYLLRFKQVILETEYVLLAMALFFFAVSVILDVLHSPGIHPYFFEDSAKLVGLVSWLAYFFRVGEYSVQLHSTPQSNAAES